MELRERLFNTALKHVGTFEWAKGSNPKVMKWLLNVAEWPKGDHVPWCSAFVLGVFRERHCHQLINGANLRAKSFLKVGREIKLSSAKIGDVVVLHRGSNPHNGHVAFFAGNYGSQIWLLGGNQSDSVNFQLFGKERVCSVRRFK